MVYSSKAYFDWYEGLNLDLLLFSGSYKYLDVYDLGYFEESSISFEIERC